MYWLLRLSCLWWKRFVGPGTVKKSHNRLKVRLRNYTDVGINSRGINECNVHSRYGFSRRHKNLRDQVPHTSSILMQCIRNNREILGTDLVSVFTRNKQVLEEISTPQCYAEKVQELPKRTWLHVAIRATVRPHYALRMPAQRWARQRNQFKQPLVPSDDVTLCLSTDKDELMIDTMQYRNRKLIREGGCLVWYSKFGKRENYQILTIGEFSNEPNLLNMQWHEASSSAHRRFCNRHHCTNPAWVTRAAE